MKRASKKVSTYSLGLLFLAPSKDDLPGPAISHVSVKTWGTHGYRGSDPPTITPQCVTIQELESQIDRLHEELEIIRKQALRKYAAYRKVEQARRDKRRSS